MSTVSITYSLHVWMQANWRGSVYSDINLCRGKAPIGVYSKRKKIMSFVSACMCVHVRACACMCVHVRACVYSWAGCPLMRGDLTHCHMWLPARCSTGLNPNSRPSSTHHPPAPKYQFKSKRKHTFTHLLYKGCSCRESHNECVHPGAIQVENCTA